MVRCKRRLVVSEMLGSNHSGKAGRADNFFAARQKRACHETRLPGSLETAEVAGQVGIDEGVRGAGVMLDRGSETGGCRRGTTIFTCAWARIGTIYYSPVPSGQGDI